MTAITPHQLMRLLIFTASMLRCTCTSSLTGPRRPVFTLSGWVWPILKTCSTTLVSRSFQVFDRLSSNYDAADKNVSLFIMAVYANFAKTGDPTPQPVSGVRWERYNSSHRALMHTPRWRPRLLLVEWLSGMITILSWRK